MDGADLQIRLLGKFEIAGDEGTLRFPPSRKARALLAYLVATARPHARERLCDLLWEGPSDPRASLRWSLSKIRPLVDREGATRLVSAEGQVGFEPRGAVVDLHSARELAGDPAAAGLPALHDAASLFRGDFLEGMDVPGCPRFDVWCTGEREKARRLRRRILDELVRRLAEEPERALGHARQRLLISPFDEDAHAAVVRLLAAAGRRDEAREQYAASRRVLSEEFGAGGGLRLESAWREVVASGAAGGVEPATTTATPGEASDPPPAEAATERAPLAGRDDEWRALEEFLATAAVDREATCVLLAGPPGIGKTRLLAELVDRVRTGGGAVLTGRAYESEMVRPYGPWVEALRAVPEEAVSDLPGLAALVPGRPSPRPEPGGEGPEDVDRSRFFEAFAALLRRRAHGREPLAVVLDDLHWFDEASLALLHFVARRTAGAGVLLALAARDVELRDNLPARRVVEALGREGRLLRVDLGPLSRAATRTLVEGVRPGLDSARVFAESEGNPLFALEIARARHEDGDGRPPERLESLIGDRLARLPEAARELLPWAAALGRRFPLDALERAAGADTSALLRGVETLERRGVLRAAGEGEYDFAHDLIRRVAYGRVSAPRRRLVHRRITHLLMEDAAGEDAPAGGARSGIGLPGERAADVAHHAALAGEPELAARACVDAARHCLGVFAHENAAELAGRGLSLIGGLPPARALPLRLPLLEVYTQPEMAGHRGPDLEEAIVGAIREAREAGLPAEVRTGFYLLSSLRFMEGDFPRALDTTLRAEEAGRRADPVTVVRAVADTARCLALLERQMPRAGRMAREARALAEEAGEQFHAIPLALGLVRRHEGSLEEARALLEEAAHRAGRERERWWQCYGLVHLPMIELESGRPERALARCGEVLPVTRKLGEDSLVPFAEALESLARLAMGQEEARPGLERAVQGLRDADSRWMIAWVQTLAAGRELEEGRTESARARAEEALRAAEVVERVSLMVLARVLLGRIARRDGRGEEAERHFEAAARSASGGQPSARAREALEAVTASRGGTPSRAGTTG